MFLVNITHCDISHCWFPSLSPCTISPHLLSPQSCTVVFPCSLALPSCTAASPYLPPPSPCHLALPYPTVVFVCLLSLGHLLLRSLVQQSPVVKCHCSHCLPIWLHVFPCLSLCALFNSVVSHGCGSCGN